MSALLKEVELQPRVCAAEGVEVYAAQTGQNADVAVVKLTEEASSSGKATFDRIVRHGALGGLQVERADGRAAIASPWPSGTYVLELLACDLQRRFAQRFHSANFAGDSGVA